MAVTVAVVKGASAGVLATSVQDYLDDVRARRLSIKTYDQYRDVLTKLLVPFCADQGIDDFTKLTSRHLNNLNATLLDEGNPYGRSGAAGERMSPHAVRSYMRTINTFLNWL